MSSDRSERDKERRLDSCVLACMFLWCMLVRICVCVCVCVCVGIDGCVAVWVGECLQTAEDVVL